MPKVTYDVSGDIPETQNAPIGWYRAKLFAAEAKDSKAGNPMVEVQFRLTHDSAGKKIAEDAYWPMRYYLMVADDRPYAKRGIRDFVEAVGLKTKGSIDTNAIVKKGPSVQLKLKSDTDQDGEYQPRIGKIVKLDADTGEEKVTPPTDDEEPEEPEAEAEEPEEEDEEEAIDLDELDRKALKKLIKDEELDIKVLKNTTDDELRAQIAEALGGDEEEEDEPEEPEEEEETDEEQLEDDGYDDMSLADLKADFKERELDTDSVKGLKGAKLKAKLIESLREDDGAEPF